MKKNHIPSQIMRFFFIKGFTTYIVFFFLLKLYLLPYSTLTTNCQQLFALKKKFLEHLTNIHEEKKNITTLNDSHLQLSTLQLNTIFSFYHSTSINCLNIRYV